MLYLQLNEIGKITKDHLEVTPLSKILPRSPRENDFIEGVVCDLQLDPNDPNSDTTIMCEEKEVIHSMQRNGVCFTYFHKMAKDGKSKRDCWATMSCGQSTILEVPLNKS